MTDHDETRTARAKLNWMFGPSRPRITRLVAEHGPVAAFDLLTAAEPPTGLLRPELQHRPGPVRDVAADAVAEAQTWCRIVTPEDEDWPAGIAGIADIGAYIPVCLWALGPAPTPQPAATVTITGTHTATAYGMWTADELATGVSVAGLNVVTTGGPGIDVAALRAAATCGTPVVVLPCGLQYQYPAASIGLYDQLAATGLLLTAWPPDARPNAQRWSANRSLLAAVSGGTVVVEAPSRGGTLRTLQRAIRYGRTGMVVPGPVTSAASAGCHQLLRDDPRVRVVTSAADVIDDLADSTGEPR
ncbi:DNA-processing protein DprA [Dactylosporangium sp. NPDC005555]|uniref:DNA-processing protein DprA n=1 Tax=Dactylosporangium sp. NPDC005555 TaxID=3154889 RepID=UPI0033B71F8D